MNKTREIVQHTDKEFKDYIIQIDCILNIAAMIAAMLAVVFKKAFGLPSDVFPFASIVTFVMLIIMSLVMDLMHILEKRRERQPYISTQFAMIFILAKVINIIFLAATVLIF